MVIGIGTTKWVGQTGACIPVVGDVLISECIDTGYGPIPLPGPLQWPPGFLPRGKTAGAWYWPDTSI